MFAIRPWELGSDTLSLRTAERKAAVFLLSSSLSTCGNVWTEEQTERYFICRSTEKGKTATPESRELKGNL